MTNGKIVDKPDNVANILAINRKKHHLFSTAPEDFYND